MWWFLGGGAFGRWSDQEGEILVSEVSALVKETPADFLPLSLRTQREVSDWVRRRPFWTPSVLALWFGVSRAPGHQPERTHSVLGLAMDVGLMYLPVVYCLALRRLLKPSPEGPGLVACPRCPHGPSQRPPPVSDGPLQPQKRCSRGELLLPVS